MKFVCSDAFLFQHIKKYTLLKAMPAGGMGGVAESERGNRLGIAGRFYIAA